MVGFFYSDGVLRMCLVFCKLRARIAPPRALDGCSASVASVLRGHLSRWTHCPAGIAHPSVQAVRVPLQAGYCEQPQNTLPEFAPRLAVRFTIALWQTGEVGALGAATIGETAAALPSTLTL